MHESGSWTGFAQYDVTFLLFTYYVFVIVCTFTISGHPKTEAGDTAIRIIRLQAEEWTLTLVTLLAFHAFLWRHERSTEWLLGNITHLANKPCDTVSFCVSLVLRYFWEWRKTEKKTNRKGFIQISVWTCSLIGNISPYLKVKKSCLHVFFKSQKLVIKRWKFGGGGGGGYFVLVWCLRI